MNDTLRGAVILAVPEPSTYRVRLDDGGEALVRPARWHFGHQPDDLEYLQSLRPGTAVTVRLTSAAPLQGLLVRVTRTEAEWLAGRDPARLLETVRHVATEPQLRRFAGACCRRLWEFLPEGQHRRLVEVLEACAEGRAGGAKVAAALAAGADEERHWADLAAAAEADPVRGPDVGGTAKAIWATRLAAHAPTRGDVFEVVLDAARSCAEAAGLRAQAEAARTGATAEAGAAARADAERAACAAQAALVRELFGFPGPA